MFCRAALSPPRAGPARVVSHAVASAGHGGLILFTPEVAAQLGMDAAGLLEALPGDCSVYHLGVHKVSEDVEDPVDILAAVPNALKGRVALRQDPLRTVGWVAPGALSAPLPMPGAAAGGGVDLPVLVFVQFSALDALMHWSAREGRATLQLAHACAMDAVAATRGCVSEDGLATVLATGKTRLPIGASLPDVAVPGRLVVAFTSPDDALSFALALRSRLLRLDWSPALLEQALFECVGWDDWRTGVGARADSYTAPQDKSERGAGGYGSHGGQGAFAFLHEVQASPSSVSLAGNDQQLDEQLPVSPRLAASIVGRGEVLGLEAPPARRQPSLLSIDSRQGPRPVLGPAASIPATPTGNVDVASPTGNVDAHGSGSSRGNQVAASPHPAGTPPRQAAINAAQPRMSHVSTSSAPSTLRGIITGRDPALSAEHKGSTLGGLLASKTGDGVAASGGTYTAVDAHMLRGLRTRTVVTTGAGAECVLAARSSGRAVYSGGRAREAHRVLKRAKPGQVLVHKDLFRHLQQALAAGAQQALQQRDAAEADE